MPILINVLRRLCRRRLSVCLFITLVLGSAAASAQALDEMSSGMDYLLVFPDTTANQRDPGIEDLRFRAQYIIAMYSAVEGTAQVSGRGWSTEVTLPARQMVTVDLNDPAHRAPAILFDRAGVVGDATFRVRSTTPVVAYCTLITEFGGEAWTPLPIEAWGTDYFAAALPGTTVLDVDVTAPGPSALLRRAAPALVTIVAAFDGTSVTVRSTGQTATPDTTVVLDAGEAWMVHGAVDTSSGATAQPDLAGTRITATQPVGVISGNTRTTGFLTSPILISTTGNSAYGMAIEWLAPASQHGTEFAFLPTYDRLRRTGEPGEDSTRKRGLELVRIYGTSALEAAVERASPSGVSSLGTVERGAVLTDSVLRPEPRYYRADAPVQAMMSSTSVVRVSTPLTNPRRYLTSAPFMVELVPREQWTTFAPYAAPSGPLDWDTYIAVVTDRESADRIQTEDGLLFPVFAQMPGGDLMFGIKSVARGSRGAIVGVDGARFYAVAYGLLDGSEWGLVGGGADYEEFTAIAYGHPLAPRRADLRASDSVIVETTSMGCARRVTVRTAGTPRAGMRRVALDSASNAELEAVTPERPLGDTVVTVVVRMVDPLLDASGVIVATSTTGARTAVRFTIPAAPLGAAPTVLDFGDTVRFGTFERELRIENTLDEPIRVDSMRFVTGRDFSVEAPTLPVVIESNGGLTLRISTTTADSVARTDTLLIHAGCQTLRVPVLRGVTPCLHADPLEFGELQPEQERTMVLTIRNVGGGQARFAAGVPPLEWSDQGFVISSSDLQRLASAVLPAGGTVSVPVVFSSPAVGEHVTWARLGAAAPGCRDSVRWRATVMPSVGVRDEAVATGALAITIEPNPLAGSGVVTFVLQRRSHVSLELYDAYGRALTTIVSGDYSIGRHHAPLVVDGLPVGVYFLRAVAAGATSVRTVVVR